MESIKPEAQELEINASAPEVARGKNRARSKTIYLDRNSTTELRQELIRDIVEFSPEQSIQNQYQSPDGYFRVHARKGCSDTELKSAVARIVKKSSDWPQATLTPAKLLPPPEEETISPLLTADPKTVPARSQLALTSILKPSDALRRAEVADVPCVATMKLNSEPLPPVVGFLVSFEANSGGEITPLRVGRIIVTSERTSSDKQLLIIEDRTVCSAHATIKVDGIGEVQVLDQFSENGTWVTRLQGDTEEKICGMAVPLRHGDTVRFGQRRFNVCLLAVAAIA